MHSNKDIDKKIKHLVAKSTDSEKVVEPRLVNGVKKLGGVAKKWQSPGVTGAPDRIVILPGPFIWFVECKSKGRKLSPTQVSFHADLVKLGASPIILDTVAKVDAFLNYLKTYVTYAK